MRNNNSQYELSKKNKTFGKLRNGGNLPHFRDNLVDVLAETFRQDFKRRQIKSIYDTQRKRFRNIHADRPNSAALLEAHDEGREEECCRLRAGIARDGSRDDLAGKRAANTCYVGGA